MSSISEIFKSSPFIEELKTGNFVICPNKILLDYKDVSPNVKFFYLYLIRYALISIVNGSVDEEGNPVVFAKNETLADEYGVSRSTVTRNLQALSKAGLCHVQRRGQGKTSLITVYPPNKKERKAKEIKSVEDLEKKTSPPKEDTGKDIEKLIESTIEKSIKNNEKHKKKREARRRTKGPVQNTNTLAEYFKTESATKLQMLPPLIGGKEKSLIKKMIEHYGYDIAKSFFDWAIENWDRFKKEKRLNGNLNVSIVWGFRDYIAGELQKENQKPEKIDAGESESAW